MANKETDEGFRISKSAWLAINGIKVLIFTVPLVLSIVLAILFESAWLLLGLLIPVGVAAVVGVQIFLLKYDYTVVYKTSFMFHKGFIVKKEKKEVYTGIRSVSVNQSFWGRILGYGEINANLYGFGIIQIKGVKHPEKVSEHLEGLIVVPDGKIKQISIN